MPRASLRGALCFLWVLIAAVAPRAHAQQLPQDAGGWSSTAGARVTVYHAPQHTELAERVLRFLVDQPPLPALPPSVPTGVSVYLAPDAHAFEGLTGGAVPEWSAGVALPGLSRIVVPLYATERGLAGERVRVLRHEWAHLGLHQQLGELRVPRWFDEGYAQWASTWDPSEVWRLRLLLATGRAPALDSLSLDWPRDAASAQAAYLLAATALEYLVAESGEHGLSVLLEHWKQSGSFETALRTTYGVTQGQLEEHWRAYVRNRYGWLLVLSHSLVLWSGLAFLLLLLLGVRRRRDRERLARLRAAEPADNPEYWSGDDDGEEPPRGAVGP